MQKVPVTSELRLQGCSPPRFSLMHLENSPKDSANPPKARQDTQKLTAFSEDYCILEVIHLPAVLFQSFHPPSLVLQIPSKGHPLWSLALQLPAGRAATGRSGCTSPQWAAAHKTPQTLVRQQLTQNSLCAAQLQSNPKQQDEKITGIYFWRRKCNRHLIYQYDNHRTIKFRNNLWDHRVQPLHQQLQHPCIQKHHTGTVRIFCQTFKENSRLLP